MSLLGPHWTAAQNIEEPLLLQAWQEQATNSCASFLEIAAAGRTQFSILYSTPWPMQAYLR